MHLLKRQEDRSVRPAHLAVADVTTISDQEFLQFQRLLRELAGISLAPVKKALVCGRLGRRLKHYRMGSYGEYFRYLTSAEGRGELQTAIDLLTTNETYFFREPRHFEFLRDQVLPARRPGTPFRVWSAACSSGEEPYSIAMVLADRLGGAPWEVLGSDLSTRVLEKARSGQYPMERARTIPEDYLKRFCLKGIGTQAGTFLIDRTLRNRVRFQQINLNASLPRLGEFDVIFLRNVMIYFDIATKRQVVGRLLPFLKPGGYFLVGHSESLNGITEELAVMSPSIYRKP
ncbi:MAG: protein-glutamate O-methyltransferase CheR [Aliarcobacter sp.]